MMFYTIFSFAHSFIFKYILLFELVSSVPMNTKKHTNIVAVVVVRVRKVHQLPFRCQVPNHSKGKQKQNNNNN